LNTLNLSTLNTCQQVVLYFLTILGNPFSVSVFVLYIRKRAFHKKFRDINDATWAPTPDSTHVGVEGAQMRTTETPTYKKPPFAFRKFLSVLKSSLGRNSQFHDLSREDWNKLGSIEYKALKMLLCLVPGYLIFSQLLGIFILAPYMVFNKSDVALSNGVSPLWLGTFLSSSAFNNCGLSLLDLNMVPFSTSFLVLVSSSVLALAGNLAFPIVFRGLLWSALKVLPADNHFQDWRETITFILKYPRRLYIYLFPSLHTWILVVILVLINGLEGIAFHFLNKKNPTLDTLPPHIQFLDAYFQTVVTRTAGFDVIPISFLRIGMQALYLAMMFVSAYPVVFAMRSSNVYEERSLGIYANELLPEKSEMFSSPNYGDEDTFLPHAPRTRAYYLQQEIRKQLGHDLWFPMATAILILWIETGSLDRDPTTFSAFNILFESVSAYAGVGLSTGLQDQAYSLCGEFHIASKLILCLAMLRGRHRGLPVAIDQAVQLPQDIPGEMEQQDHEIRTRFSLVDAALESRPPFSTRPSDQIK
ncbi:Potassium transport protein, partial [Lachnellula hyalina]